MTWLKVHTIFGLLPAPHHPLHLFGAFHPKSIHSCRKFCEQTFSFSYLTHLVQLNSTTVYKVDNIPPHIPLPTPQTGTRESSKLQSINIMWDAHGRYISRALRNNELAKAFLFLVGFIVDLCWVIGIQLSGFMVNLIILTVLLLWNNVKYIAHQNFAK